MEVKEQSFKKKDVINVFIIGAKSIGQYGGFETFVDRLIEQHQSEKDIKYHIACKANGDGFMDETKLKTISDVVCINGEVCEFTYHNARIFKIHCPKIGPAVAIYYDKAAIRASIKYCKDNQISSPIFYILTCRIGLFINDLLKQIRSLGGSYMLNPDGHEWKRTKWPWYVQKYWKWSEKKMVAVADLIICDSECIEKYICTEYSTNNTIFIPYGADVDENDSNDRIEIFENWLKKTGTNKGQYYLSVARLVPENNYETMIREFMKSNSRRNLVIVSNENIKFKKKLEHKLGFQNDKRIKFVCPVYDRELLEMIRKNAYGYIHGHEVGGTNPSLLEAMADTKLNLLLDVEFNKEVGKEAVLYWNKQENDLSKLIDIVDSMSEAERNYYGEEAKRCIKNSYNWIDVGVKYKNLWTTQINKETGTI